MGNDWTRLVQEASKHSGPDGLRAFYASKGRWQGLAAGVLAVGSIALAVKAKESFAKAKAAKTAETDLPPEPRGGHPTENEADTTPEDTAPEERAANENPE